MLCVYCGEKLVLTERGWVHIFNGAPGSAYMQACPQCGWMGSPLPPQDKCPICGANLYDDHVAKPIEKRRPW